MTTRTRGGARAARDPRAPAGASAARGPALLLAALALGLVLRAAASFTPFHAFWGLDTLRGWPLPPALAVLLLGALGFVPPVARVLERAMDGIGAMADRLGVLPDAVLAAGTCVALFKLRDPVMFTGDYSTRLSQLMLEAPVAKVFPQASPLDRWVNIEIPRLLINNQHLSVPDAMHVVGAVVGAGFAFAALAFLRAAGATRAARVAGAAVALGGAYLLHFAGYDKFGPLLFGIALAAYGAARLARDGRGAWALGAGAAICVLAHRSGYALLPAAGLVLVQAWRRAADGRARIELAIAAGLMLAAAFGLLPKTLHLIQTVDRAQALPGAPQGGGPANVRGLADVALRIGDALNLLFFTAPLWLAGAAAAWVVRGAPPPREAARFPLAPAAWLAIGAELALVLVLRGAQGVSRDWDMHVAPALVVTLLTAAALIAVWRRLGAAGTLAPALTTALASAVALWGLHLSEPIAVARISELLRNRSAWSNPAWARAHDFLGVRALQRQRPDLAIRELEAAITVAPNPRFFFEMAIAYRMMGRRAEALATNEKAHRLDPGLSDPWVGFALLAVDVGDFARAIAACDSALALAPHRKDAKQIRESVRRALEAGGRPESPFGAGAPPDAPGSGPR
jgi:hypothetical protein